MRVNKQSKSETIGQFFTHTFLVGVVLIALIAGLAPNNAQATDTGYYGEYWNNPTGGGGQSPSFPGGSPVYTHTDSEINFNWGFGSPNGAVQNEDFVTRWTRTTYLAAGTYHFSIGSDDGNRVYIDNNLIINSWVDQGANPAQTADVDIAAGNHTIKVEYYENGAVAEVYFSFTNTTDGDGDGANNTIEAAGPNSGDANNDGTADSSQANVVSFENQVANKYAALEVSSGCTIISSTVSAESANSSVDSAFDYPIGLMNFNLSCSSPGATVTVSQYFFEPTTTSTTLRKYNSINHSYQAVGGASVSSVTIGGKAATKVTYQITDGGALDEDGAANGTIVDPSGLGSAVVIAPNTGLGGLGL